MRFVLLLIAAVIAVGAGIFALKWSGADVPGMPQQQTNATAAPESQNVATVDVLVAREPIAVGSVIKEDMIDKQPWPQHLVLDGFIVSGNKDANVVGRVARSSFQAREPFMLNKLANPNDPSFLAAALPQGMRAVTMATDAVSGVAGFVFPGDRVDVLLTHNIPYEIEKRATGEQILTQGQGITEVLAPNVRVLAVNVRPTPGKENVQTPTPSSVTIEVTEEAAQKLRLAEKIGTVALALRSLKDKDDVAGEVAAPTLLDNLTHVRIRETAGTGGIKVVRGAGNDKTDKRESMVRRILEVFRFNDEPATETGSMPEGEKE